MESRTSKQWKNVGLDPKATGAFFQKVGVLSVEGKLASAPADLLADLVVTAGLVILLLTRGRGKPSENALKEKMGSLLRKRVGRFSEEMNDRNWLEHAVAKLTSDVLMLLPRSRGRPFRKGGHGIIEIASGLVLADPTMIAQIAMSLKASKGMHSKSAIAAALASVRVREVGDQMFRVYQKRLSDLERRQKTIG